MIHQVGHHITTNINELDPDIHTNEPHFRKIKKDQKMHFWYRYQHIYLPLLYSTLVFELYFRDFLAFYKKAWGGLKFQPIPTFEYYIFFIGKSWYFVYNFMIPYYFNCDMKKVFLSFVIMSVTFILK
jgi:hypothetical protein